MKNTRINTGILFVKGCLIPKKAIPFRKQKTAVLFVTFYITSFHGTLDSSLLWWPEIANFRAFTHCYQTSNIYTTFYTRGAKKACGNSECGGTDYTHPILFICPLAAISHHYSNDVISPGEHRDGACTISSLFRKKQTWLIQYILHCNFLHEIILFIGTDFFSHIEIASHEIVYKLRAYVTSARSYEAFFGRRARN
jgi:hypothetical protein